MSDICTFTAETLNFDPLASVQFGNHRLLECAAGMDDLIPDLII
jgi:hypothetical protein